MNDCYSSSAEEAIETQAGQSVAAMEVSSRNFTLIQCNGRVLVLSFNTPSIYNILQSGLPVGNSGSTLAFGFAAEISHICRRRGR